MKTQEQIKELKYRSAIVQMEKRMFVPYFTNMPGEAAFETSKSTVPNKAFQLTHIPQQKDYVWVAQKQEAGKITLGTGCVLVFCLFV
jgi:hypothetical protein